MTERNFFRSILPHPLSHLEICVRTQGRVRLGGSRRFVDNLAESGSLEYRDVAFSSLPTSPIMLFANLLLAGSAYGALHEVW